MKWIPVSERLPDDNFVVLVACERRSFVTTATYYANVGGKWEEDNCCSDTLKVTHWMPIPEKPEGDE